MDFIRTEIARINEKMNELHNGQTYDQLNLAQKTLKWALEPRMAYSPYGVITGDTRPVTANCPVHSYPIPSLDSNVPRERQE